MLTLGLFIIIVLAIGSAVSSDLPVGLAILPIVFLICEVWAKNLRMWTRVPDGIGVKLFRMIIFVKYYVTPLYILLTRNTEVPGVVPSEQSVLTAIGLMTYELLSVYIFISLLMDKWDTHPKINTSISSYKNYTLLLLFVFVIVLIINPNAFSINLGILFNSDVYNQENVTLSITPTAIVLTKFLKTLLFVIPIYWAYDKYTKSHKKTYVYLSLLICAVFILLFISSSRWNLLFSLLGGMFILTSLYGKVVKKYVVLISSIGFALLLGVTIYKFKWQLQGDVSVTNSIKVIFSFLQPYFSGPYVTAQGVQMSRVFVEDLTFKTCFNDYLFSIPFISNFMDRTNITNFYFNKFVLGDTTMLSQLVPGVSSGYAYFGFVFSNILTICFVFALFYFTNKQNMCKDPIKAFFILLGTLWLSLVLCVNTQTVFGNCLHSSIIPLIILHVARIKLSQS